MLSLVCILHSADGTYSDELIHNATHCATAVTRSAAASAPDRIPAVAILRADPIVGAKYLYTSAVPDTNHAVEAGEMHHAPFSPSLQQVSVKGQTSSTAGDVFDFTNAFRGRSMSYLNESIAYGARAQAVEAEQDERLAAVVSGVEGLQAAPKHKRAKLDRASVSNNETDDVWGPLAAALLSSLAFLHKHTADAQDITTTTAASTPSTFAGDGAQTADPSSLALSRRNLVVIFTSCARSGTALSYSTECALAVTTLCASRENATVFCVGDGIAESEDVEASETDGGGAARLRAMAASVGGACATHFCRKLLGLMLDGRSALKQPTEAATAGETGQQQQQPLATALSTRARRERIADQYVFRPTVLARKPDKAGLEHVDGGGDGKHRTCKATERDERVSSLGWLCPHCMAVVYRAPTEAQGSAAAENVDGTRSIHCPFCL